jgi:sugar lactone lactonase YvrE
MKYPLAVVVGKDSSVYVADRDLPGIWKYADNKWSVYFQGSKKFRTPLNAVRCLAIDQDGKLLAGDSATREIYRFDDAAQPQPLTKGNVGIPMAITVGKDGTIYASDIEIQRIVKIPTAGGEPEEVAELAAVRGLTIDAEGRLIAVCHGKDAVIRLSTDGKDRTVLVEGRPFNFSHHVVLGANGEAYIADGYAKTIWKFDGTGAPMAFVSGEPLKNPVGVALLDGNLLIADPHVKAILRRTADGKLETFGK